MSESSMPASNGERNSDRSRRSSADSLASWESVPWLVKISDCGCGDEQRWWHRSPFIKKGEKRTWRMRLRALLQETQCPICNLFPTFLSRFSSHSLGTLDLDKSEAYFICARGQDSGPLRVEAFLRRNPTCSSDERYEKVMFELFVDSEPAVGDIGIAPLVHKTLTESRRRSLLRQWIETCERDHDGCRLGKLENDFHFPMRRILDLRPRGLPDDCIKLVKGGSVSSAYATLSHCWGGTMTVTTVTKNLKARMRSIGLRYLTPGYRDAVETAREQGIRYLWIDSLCIIQDDIEDWEWHAVKMAHIYSLAYLNIGLTAGGSSMEGIPERRWADKSKGLPFESCSVDITYDGEVIAVHARRPFEASNTDFTSRGTLGADGDKLAILTKTAPLLTRGWVYQERLLSARMVHFHSSEMVWECRTRIMCECGCLDRDLSRDTARGMAGALRHLSLENRHEYHDKELLGMWFDALAHYVRQRLTRPSDRLPALAGLAHQFRGATGLHYMAGHFTTPRDIIRSLLWTVSKPYIRSATSFSRRQPGFLAPTWSILSISIGESDGIRSAPLSVNNIVPDYRAEVLTVAFSHQTDYSTATGWFIDICAPLVLAKVCFGQYELSNWDVVHTFKIYPSNWSLGSKWGTQNGYPDYASPSNEARFYPDCDSWRTRQPLQDRYLYLLLLATGISHDVKVRGRYQCGLALEMSSSRQGQMERIGVFKIWDKLDFFKYGQCQSVRIV